MPAIYTTSEVDGFISNINDAMARITREFNDQIGAIQQQLTEMKSILDTMESEKLANELYAASRNIPGPWQIHQEKRGTDNAR